MVKQSDHQLLLQSVTKRLQDLTLNVVTAESCTGGLLAASLSELAGSSAWFERGFITYTDTAKHDILGVTWQSLEQYSAVSKPVVEQMAKGALQHSQAQISLATTGYAGPTADDPQALGLVWLAIANQAHCHCQAFHFAGHRQAIRQQAVRTSLQLLADLLNTWY